MCIFRERKKKSLLHKASSTGRIRFYASQSYVCKRWLLNTNTSRHDQHLIEFPEVASLQSVSLLSIIIHLMNKFFDFFLICSRSGKRSIVLVKRPWDGCHWWLLVTRMDRRSECKSCQFFALALRITADFTTAVQQQHLALDSWWEKAIRWRQQQLPMIYDHHWLIMRLQQY